MQQVNLTEAEAELKHLVDAALKGETVLIVRDDQQMVQLVPLKLTPRKRVFGSGAGGILYMSADFDAPLDDFADYMP